MKTEKQNCPYCDDSFWRESELDRHIYSYHQDATDDAQIVDCPSFSEEN